MASGLLPPSGLRKVVLLTDGWDTAGQAEKAARSLPAGTRLDVYPRPAMEGQPEMLVESVPVLSYVREGDSFDVSAVVGSNHEGSTQVSVAVDGKQTGSWTIQIAPGANLVTMPQKPLSLGFHSVRVDLAGGGETIAENNWGTGYVVVKKRGNVLLIDGQSWRGPYHALLQSMNQDQVTLSTIAVGTDADSAWLSELARLGDGRYYFTNQFSDIPQIVIREGNAATKVSKVEGQVEPRVASPTPILRGMDNGTLPPLGGYVATMPKDTSTTVLKCDRGDPLLAQWQYGLGRVVAWTSDTEGMWSSSWLAQSQFSRVWDQSVRWSMAPPVDRSLQVSALVDGDKATISVNSVDQNGLFINLAGTRAQITDPNGNQSVAQLQQTAAGHYEATISATEPGLYRVDVSQTRQGQTTPVMETSGFVASSSPEFRRLGSNDALLKGLAAMMGGRAISDPTEAFSREGMPPSSGWQPLWGYLLAFALLMLPLEIAIRRIRALPFARQREGGKDGQVVELNPSERGGRAA